MKSQMTIEKKLMLGFAGAITVGGAIAVLSLFSIQSLNSRFDTAVSKTARKMELGGDIDKIKSDMYVAQRGSVLATFMKDSSRAQSLRNEFESDAAKLKQLIEEIRPLISVPEGRRLLESMESDVSVWLREYQEVVRRCTAGDPAGAQQHSFDKIAPIYKRLGTSADRFVEVYREVLESDKRAAAQQYQQAVLTVFVAMGVLVALGVVIFLVVRNINRVLRRVAGEMAEGADQVASASQQVSSSSQSLAQGASEQAASLEETSASSEEINSMTHRNAENSQAAAKLTTRVDEQMTSANRTVEQAVTAMAEINGSSEKISKIIKVIDDISFQTNILALNAAVEAARAGEAGMGFAVVADEVRNLAQRCSQAAKDTAALIEESIAKSRDGSAKLGQVDEAIRSITSSAAEVKTLIDEVHLGSKEQARGIEQISKAIVQMEQVTQATAASAEESASAAEELSAQSETVKSLVGKLASMVGGVDSDTKGHAERGPVRSERSSVTRSNLMALKAAVSHNSKRTAEVASGFHMEENFHQ